MLNITRRLIKQLRRDNTRWIAVKTGDLWDLYIGYPRGETVYRKSGTYNLGSWSDEEITDHYWYLRHAHSEDFWDAPDELPDEWGDNYTLRSIPWTLTVSRDDSGKKYNYTLRDSRSREMEGWISDSGSQYSGGVVEPFLDACYIIEGASSDPKQCMVRYGRTVKDSSTFVCTHVPGEPWQLYVRGNDYQMRHLQRVTLSEVTDREKLTSLWRRHVRDLEGDPVDMKELPWQDFDMVVAEHEAVVADSRFELTTEYGGHILIRDGRIIRNHEVPEYFRVITEDVVWD